MKLLLLAALFLGGSTFAACSVDEPATSEASIEQGLECEPYDEAYCDPVANCEVQGSYVSCSSGITMFAYATPDCRFCIPRFVCGANEPICPF
jgi:hypothetical protein